MRTTIEISDALLNKARRLMAKRRTTLRQLVEEALRRLLDDESPPTVFRLRDARFAGRRGFAAGFGPDDVAAVLHDMNEPRSTR